MNAIICICIIAICSDVVVAGYDVKINSTDFGCLKNNTDKKTKSPLPFEFLNNYKFRIQIRDLVDLTTDYALGVSLNNGMNTAIQLQKVHDKSLKESENRMIYYSFAINGSGYGQYITNKTYCSMVNFAGNWVSTNPFEQPQIVVNISKSNQTWKSLNDIFEWANASAQWSWVEKSHSINTSVSGLAEHNLWSGCTSMNKSVENEQSFIEMRIGYLPKEAKYAYPSIPSNTMVPLYVRILVYDVKDDDDVVVSNDITYDINLYSPIDNPDDEMTLTVPPPGVYCKDSLVKTAPSIPVMPNAFTTEIEYIDVDNKITFTEKLFYSKLADRQLFAYTFHEEANKLGFVGDIGLKGIKEGFVVHDFDYGIQYVLDRHRTSCLSVSLLPTTAGDVITEGKTIELDSPINLLLRAPASNYTYAGEIALPAYLNVNIFKNSQKDSKGVTTVREVFFNSLDKKTASLLNIDVYTWQKVELGQKPSIAKMHYYNQQPVYGALQWQFLNVGACAKIDELSYFMISINDFNLVAQSAKGLTSLKEAVIEQLAAHANVSALRLPMSQVYLKNISTEAEPNKANILFEIAEPTGLKHSTSQFEVEISVAEAVKNLNDTLQVNDIEVKVSHKVTIKIQKESLQAIPVDFAPPIPHPIPPTPKPDGHGGSMAALAFCMLIIGAAFGIVGGWWMWKRNRGIAYQIYE